MEALEALGGEMMARDPDRRVSIAPQPTRSFSDSTLGAADEAAPATGSGRAHRLVVRAVEDARVVDPLDLVNVAGV